MLDVILGGLSTNSPFKRLFLPVDVLESAAKMTPPSNTAAKIQLTSVPNEECRGNTHAGGCAHKWYSRGRG